MTNFEEALKKWNSGIYDGARTKFAKSLGVTLQSVRLWCEGRAPGEQRRGKIAEMLGVTVSELVAMFPEKIEGDNFSEVEIKQRTPIVGIINGKDEYFQADFDTKTPMEVHKMPTIGEDGEEMVGLKINGDMGELASDGDYVYIGVTSKPENRGFVLIKLNEGYSFKKISIAGKFAILNSLTSGDTLRLPLIALNVVGMVRCVLSRKFGRPHK